MALNIDPASIAEALRRNVESWEPSSTARRSDASSRPATASPAYQGLPRAMANELLEFPGGLLGMAFNLDEDEIGCIILGESAEIEEGDPVKQTGRILSVPVGDGFLGRVVDALGPPARRQGRRSESEETRNLEVQAPNVVSRQPVKEPMYTGIIGDRRDDGDRAGAAPAHHRRPADGQDGRRARRDHRAARALGHRPRGEVHLRRDRAEGLDRRRGRRDPPRERGARSTRRS